MKIKYLPYLLIILFIACKKNDTSVAPIVVPEKPFTTYTILKGEHYASGYDSNHIVIIKTTDLKFTAKFDSSCIYTATNIENSEDVNKLYGFSDNKSSHHLFSARIGWAYYFKALRLFGYTYNNGVRTILQLCTVPIGKEISCRIQIDAANSNYVFTVDGLTVKMPRQANEAQAVGYRLYPYFGGSLVAPHNVTILVRDE